MNIQRITCVLSILAVSVVAFPVQPVQAQSGGEVEELEELITIGTRREGGRSTTDSLVPVDVLSGDDLLRTGNTDIVTVLTNLVPSYNANTQAINDAATLVRPAQLRGLPPDSTLVLVNGKRRHRAAVITFLGNGISDGAQGADISTIPAVALKRVEVLRDGAAAQYGSDAIAGVMNFELKDDAEGGSVEARWGQHYEGDGDGFNFAGNIGLPLGSNGFANLSAEYRDVKGTNRSVQRSDAERLIAAGNTAITDPNYDSIFHPNVMIWGAPEVKYDYKIFGNFGMDLSDNMEVYGHTNYAKRKVEGGFFFRNPHTRNGVFNGDVVDGNNEVLELQALNNDGTPKVDDNNMPVMESFGSIGAIGLGGPHDAIRRGQLAGINIDDLRDTVKVADIGGLGTCSPIRIDNDVAREGDITAVENDDNCQSFITRFPGGFTPRFGGVMEDYSFAVGVRGDFGDWYVDVSGVYGRHSVDYFMRHTLNPQLLALTEEGITVANIPTDYNPGAYTQTDYSINLDLSRSLELGFASPVNVAFGGEHRQEKFKVTQGGRNSWYQDLESGGLSEQGFGVGSNGFTGFGPRLAGTWSRNSYAGYIDVEAEVVPGITFGAAGRYEDHEDVGNTADFKFSGRWQAADTFAVRGAVSTGFRAPTPGQANILNITTAFTAGVLADEATLPPTHPASLLLGGKALTPEESTNFTGGMVFNMGDLDVTFDYFHIKVKDRIARSGAQDLTPAQTQTLKDQGVAGADALTSVRFYTNDFDTVTQGIDIVATYPMEMFGGNTIFNFAANWTKTEVDSRDPFVDINGDPILTDAGEIQYAIDDKRVIQLERNLPRIRFTGTASHRNGPWDFTTRLRFYGKFTEFSTDSGGARLDAGSRALIDIEASYTWNDNLTFILGADNVFDTHPTDQSNNASPYVSGQEYAETSPYGFNGGFYYLRAIWQY